MSYTSRYSTSSNYIDASLSHTIQDIMMKYDQDLIVSSFQLIQNYPNPFNSSTTIEYEISKDGFVRLEIYDIIGRRVQILVDEIQLVGRHAVRFDASNFSSGVYLYRLQRGSDVQTKKMTLIK